MVRRDASSPSYLTLGKTPSGETPGAPKSAWRQFVDAQFSDPENRSANLKLASAVGLFAGGIAFLRVAGDVFVPGF